MVGAWTYALAVNFVPSYRVIADKIGDSAVGIKHAPDEEKAVHDTSGKRKHRVKQLLRSARKFELNMKGYVLDK